jgi:V/A-type H+-transporting ATPase subunit D
VLVRRGPALLRRKREALVAELFARARPALDARRALDERARAAYRALLEALAAEGRVDLLPLGWPARDLQVQLELRDVGGIRGAALLAKPRVVRDGASRGGGVGPGDAEASMAAEHFERLVEALLEIAPEDVFLRRLGQELARVTRLVNTLERRVAASVARELAAMRRTLDEREREEHLRLKRRVRRRAG